MCVCTWRGGFWIPKFWKFWKFSILKLIVLCFFRKNLLVLANFFFFLQKIAKTIGFGSFFEEHFQNFQNFGVRILEILAKTSRFFQKN